jgi:flavorubredoxin
MQTRISEIADGVFQLTTYLAPIDFSLNQYLVAGEEPLLFHTGLRSTFASVSAAVAQAAPVTSVRWISFGHVEADECGAMNQWLNLAPRSTVMQGRTGCMVSIGDLADRPPHALADGETLDLGGHRLRWIDTPHVPHAWEAGLLYDEATGTLLCGDLFSQIGDYPPATTADIVTPAIDAEDLFRSSSLTPDTGPTIRRLAALDIATLAPMHGPAFTGDCRAALETLALDYDRRVATRSAELQRRSAAS